MAAPSGPTQLHEPTEQVCEFQPLGTEGVKAPLKHEKLVQLQLLGHGTVAEALYCTEPPLVVEAVSGPTQDKQGVTEQLVWDHPLPELRTPLVQVRVSEEQVLPQDTLP